jgi:predicted nucleotidyltransferase
MTATTPIPPTRQELIRLLRKHKQEWRSLYGIQDITLFASQARDEATASSDVDLCVIFDPPSPLPLCTFATPFRSSWAQEWMLCPAGSG